MGNEHAKFDPETENHPESGTCGCVWKHAGEIKKSQWDSHPCHYPTQGVKSARAHPKSLNGDHRGRAVQFKYLARNPDGTYRVVGEVVGQHARGKAPDRQQRKEERGEKFDLAKFMQKFAVERSERALDWLVREEEGWKVDHQHPDLKDVKAITLRSRKGHPGQRYPYLHEHHHIIPSDALNRFVLAPPGEEGKRDARVKVLLKAKWNLNHEDNMIVLPSEVVPARVLGLPAHCPWDEADHPKYTDSLEVWLKNAKRSIDGKLKEEKHEVIAKAGQKLTKVSSDLRKVIEQERGGSKLGTLREPKAGEA